MMSKFDDTDRFPFLAAVLWTAAHWDSEALADEARAELELVEREAQVEVLEIAADHELADVELSSPLGPMHLAGMRAGIEIAREALERLATHLRNPQPATDAEQVEAEKAEE